MSHMKLEASPYFYRVLVSPCKLFLFRSVSHAQYIRVRTDLKRSFGNVQLLVTYNPECVINVARNISWIRWKRAPSRIVRIVTSHRTRIDEELWRHDVPITRGGTPYHAGHEREIIQHLAKHINFLIPQKTRGGVLQVSVCTLKTYFVCKQRILK